jgi:hypothetical protein
LRWLRTDLAAWTHYAETGSAINRARVRSVIWARQNDPRLASVRDKKQLAALPGPERGAWENLWADVEALRTRVSETK